MVNDTAVTPPFKPAHGFTYTKRNQLETYTLPDTGTGTATESRFYDDDRRLQRITRPDAQEIVFHYEPYRNRLQTLTTPRGDLTFTYQPDGKLDTATTFDGQTLDFAYDGPVLTGAVWTGTVTGSVERSYDNSLRLDTLKVNGADPVSFTYDDDSLLLSAGALGIVLEPDTGRLDTVTVDQITTEWIYTPFGEAASMTTRHGGTVIYGESFVYDKRGWITDLDRTQNGSTVLQGSAQDPDATEEAGQADDWPSKVSGAHLGEPIGCNRNPGPQGEVIGAWHLDRAAP